MSIEGQMKIAVILSAYDKMSATINAAVNKAQGKLTAFSNKADHLANKSFNTGRNLVTAGLAVGAPLYEAVKVAQEFETKMIDIRKQMQFDTPETVKKMAAQVMELGKQLPLATSEIQDMIASGLRMGIAEDKIVEYTRQVTKMSVAFDMSGGEIADSMGKIANVFKIPIDKIGDFADAINYLDDNTMAKGPELIDVLQRIGQTSRYMQPKNAAVLASTMLSLGESAETSGSGINKLVTVLGAASVQSGKVQKGLAMLGLNAMNVQKSFTVDAQGTIIDVFERINKLPKVDQASALNRLFGLEQGPKLAKLVNNVEMYRKQLDMVNGKEKGSMDREYQKRIKGSAAQFQIFKNRVTELSVSFGNNLLPVFNKVIAKLGGIMEKVGKFMTANPGLTKAIGLIAGGFAAVALIGGGLSFVIGGVASFFSILSSTGMIVVKVFGFISKAFQVLRLIIMVGGGPILLIIAAIGVAAFLIIKYWDKIKAFFIRLWAAVKQIFTRFWTWIKELFLNYTPYGLIIKHWDKIKAFFIKLWSAVKVTTSAAWEAIKGFVVAPIIWIKKKWEDLLSWFSNAWKKVKGWAKDAFSWAVTSPTDKLIDKMKKSQPALEAQMKKTAQIVDDYLPHSPAKKGALSRLNKIRIVETIAETIKPNLLANKMQKVAQSVSNTGIKGTGSGAGGMNVKFEINLTGGATKADGQLLTAAIKKEFGQFMKQYGQQKDRLSFG